MPKKTVLNTEIEYALRDDGSGSFTLKRHGRTAHSFVWMREPGTDREVGDIRGGEGKIRETGTGNLKDKEQK